MSTDSKAIKPQSTQRAWSVVTRNASGALCLPSRRDVMEIARHFSAGYDAWMPSVPEGRLNVLVSVVPLGLSSSSFLDPALKYRAISMPPRWGGELRVSQVRRSVCLICALCALCALCGLISAPLSAANINDDVAKYINAPRAFPTWEQTKPIDGSLVEVDVIHRTAIVREDGSDTLHAVTMPANGVISRIGVWSDLRDVPLGTHGRWYLLPDKRGALTQLGAFHDDATLSARENVRFRVEAIDAASSTISIQPMKGDQPAAGATKIALKTDQYTRFRKGNADAKFADVAVGDLLTLNRSGDSAAHRASEVWIGADAQTRAVEGQLKAHLEFLKVRGLPAWVEAIDGKNLVLTPFAASPADLLAIMKLADIKPEEWAKGGRGTAGTVVANQELRSYNPPVDREWGRWVDWQPVESHGIGHGGHRWTVTVNHLLEGFRPGEVVRVFARDNWKVEDMPFGEGIYDHVWESPEIDPGAYPYRTDFCNDHLPWYKLQPGRLPPGESAHQRWGDLIELAADGRSGRFRDELTVKNAAFTVPPWATAWSQGSEGLLSDIPLGTRCRFAFHQDAGGAFTVASQVHDEFTVQKQRRLTARVIAVRADRGEVHVAWQLPKEQNYDGDSVTPPDTGSAILPVDADTKLWRGEQSVALAELKSGDVLLMNRTGGTTTTLPRCTGLWIGDDTIKALAERQHQKHEQDLRRLGIPALVEKIDGRLITMMVIGADREAFKGRLGDDPWGKQVHLQVVDERLKPRGAPQAMGFNNNIPEHATYGCYGASGRHWVFDNGDKPMPDGLVAGGWIRVFNHGWALPAAQ